ncbi:hypothetical protein N7466_011232 [Penicillium verhagenii]|uniref:uncharacterized protein n=1 Tax=Penicillium verhagenii TaxID=1562060 RepID=UPI002544F290|nr:uncharacterized protein N7466_011232 [Penicillium verhagenii]KAJ5917678.1 hypothetical protein N7466_011232 [Penicillium verhagenii]
MMKKALLIAIEYLPSSDNEERLDEDVEDLDEDLEGGDLFMGCINDVLGIESHLLEACGFQQENIQKLISYPPTHEEFQDEAKPPTYSNLLEAFDFMHKEGNESDIFYFHFSGPSCKIYQEAVGGYPKRDKGLRILDDSEQKSYIYESELVFIFKKLAEKGIDCCVTIDSCDNGDIETSPNFRGSRLSNCQLAGMLDHFSLEGNYQNARLQNQDSPLSHTVLSLKSGQGQSAKSVYDASLKKHFGFLTAFLLLIIKRSTTPLTWDEIVWEIGLETGDRNPTVRSSGSTDRLFLCGQKEQMTYSLLRFSGTLDVLGKKPTKLIIEGGEVHGLFIGAMGCFTPLRREVREKGISGSTTLFFKIVNVNQLFSHAELNDASVTIEMGK